MIIPYSTFDPNITIKQINDIAEREGYDRFLPNTFIKHLAYSFSFYLVGKSPKECIQETNLYTEAFYKIISMINYEEVNTYNPIVFSIKILKSIHKKFDLRKLESSALVGMSFCPEEQDTFQNYKCNTSSLTDYQLDILGIDRSEIDTIELSDEVQKLLLFHDGLAILKQTVENRYDVVEQQIKSFGDFHKIRRYKFCLPSFRTDLGMKKLQITKVDDIEIKSSEVIVVIDFSMSMCNHKDSLSLIKSVILYYIGQLEKMPKLSVTVVFVIGSINAIQTFNFASELGDLIKCIPKFSLPVYSAENIFGELNILYPGRSIIFITDGNLKLSKKIKLKYQLYSIVLSFNDLLKQMSLLSGGQFIILK